MAIKQTKLVADLSSQRVEGRVSGNLLQTRLLYAKGVYSTRTGGPEAAGDVIEVVKLPVGAIVVPSLWRVISDDLGTAAAITKMGDAADDDRYSSTSMAVASASNHAVTPVINAFVIGEATSTITATIAPPAGGFTENRTITFLIAYIAP